MTEKNDNTTEVTAEVVKNEENTNPTVEKKEFDFGEFLLEYGIWSTFYDQGILMDAKQEGNVKKNRDDMLHAMVCGMRTILEEFHPTLNPEKINKKLSKTV